MTCSTVHLFLGILCIFNIILYKSINLESIIENFDINSLKSQINLLETQIASLQSQILEQQKLLKDAMTTYSTDPKQKNKDEYEFLKEEDRVNQQLLGDMKFNLDKLKSQLEAETKSINRSFNSTININVLKNQELLNLLINELKSYFSSEPNAYNDINTEINTLQNSYNKSKSKDDKDKLDNALAYKNIFNFIKQSIESYITKFQSLSALEKNDSNIKKILSVSSYPIVKSDPNFKDNSNVYNQQIIIVKEVLKTGFFGSPFEIVIGSNMAVMEMVKKYEIETSEEEKNNMASAIGFFEFIKIYTEILNKFLQNTQQIISLGTSSQPTAPPTTRPTAPPTTRPTAPLTTRPTGQNQYDIVLDIDDKLNPIYPPPSTQTPDAYNSVSEKQMNNTPFVSSYVAGQNEKVVVDQLQLYYIDKKEDITSLMTPTPTPTTTTTTTPTTQSDLVKELKYDTTKNGNSIINCMIAIIVFCIMMLITTILLPYLIDNQLIISIIIIVINLAIMITVLLLTYYLFDNNVEDNVNKMKINNYKLNGMTIMGYLVAIMGLIIFFVCGVPNMFLLFNPEQSTQPTSQL
jgi:hypothetical protein